MGCRWAKLRDVRGGAGETGPESSAWASRFGLLSIGGGSDEARQGVLYIRVVRMRSGGGKKVEIMVTEGFGRGKKTGAAAEWSCP